MNAYAKRQQEALRAKWEAQGYTMGVTPTEAAKRDHQLQKSVGRDERIARGTAQRSRPAHQFCPRQSGYENSCGWIGAHGHHEKMKANPGASCGCCERNCQTGCGTHSERRCGGRRYAALSRISFVKSDASHRIWIGERRQQRIRERGW